MWYHCGVVITMISHKKTFDNDFMTYLRFPIIHKVGNVDNFVLPKPANK